MTQLASTAPKFSLIFQPHEKTKTLFPLLKAELDLMQKKTAVDMQILRLENTQLETFTSTIEKSENDLLVFVDQEMSSPFKDILMLAEETQYVSPNAFLWGDRGHVRSRALASKNFARKEALLLAFARDELKLNVKDATPHLFACRKQTLRDCLTQDYFRGFLTGTGTCTLLWPLRLAHSVQCLGHTVHSLPIHWTPQNLSRFNDGLWSNLKIQFALIKWRGDLANLRHS